MATGGFDGMTREQQEQMLAWFMHRVGPDQREELAGTLPAAYNAWCGSQVVQVVSVSDTSRVWRTTRRELVDGRFVTVTVGDASR